MKAEGGAGTQIYEYLSGPSPFHYAKATRVLQKFDARTHSGKDPSSSYRTYNTTVIRAGFCPISLSGVHECLLSTGEWMVLFFFWVLSM